MELGCGGKQCVVLGVKSAILDCCLLLVLGNCVGEHRELNTDVNSYHMQ